MTGVARYEDLDCWKLAMEFADLLDRMTAEGEASKDYSFRNQLRRAGTKAPAQIAEGFLRYLPGDCANYLRMARASLGEAQTHLERGRRRNYWDDETFQKAMRLSNRAIGATTNFMLDRLKAAEAQKRAPSPRAAAAPRTARTKHQRTNAPSTNAPSTKHQRTKD